MLLDETPVRGGDPRQQAQIGVGNSIAVDANNAPHVAYVDQSRTGSHKLLYATRRQDGTWVPENFAARVVDTREIVGRVCSIAVGPNNAPHISYVDRRNNNLLYLRKSRVYH